MRSSTDGALTLRALSGIWLVSGAAFLSLPAAAQVAGAARAVSAASAEVSIETTAAMCMGCHGIKGYQASFPEVHRVPKISGQNQKYLEAALTAYASGERRHPTMRGISLALDESEMARITEYYTRAPNSYPAPRTNAAVKPTPRVEALLTKGGCVSCHGKDFNTSLDPTYPKLAGQYPDYLFVVLKSYKSQPSRLVGRSHPIMSELVKQFDNAELKEMADYIGALPGDLGVTRPRRLR